MTSRAQALKRLQSPVVNYMELTEVGGAFSCGNCRFATPESFCMNRSVLAPVSLMHGCCNLFMPRSEEPVPAAQWEAFR